MLSSDDGALKIPLCNPGLSGRIPGGPAFQFAGKPGRPLGQTGPGRWIPPVPHSGPVNWPLQVGVGGSKI